MINPPGASAPAERRREMRHSNVEDFTDGDLLAVILSPHTSSPIKKAALHERNRRANARNQEINE